MAARKKSDSVPGPRGPLEKVLATALRRAVRAQSEGARQYVDKLRAANPGATPAQIRAKLDRRFLSTVTASGTAIGAAGAVPGIGTATAVGAIGAESVAFLDLAALYTMSIAAVHGIDLRDDEHRETLVMTVLLGASGTALVAGSVGRSGAAGSSLAGRALNMPSVRGLNNKLARRMVRRFFTRRTGLILGKLAPAGVGAAIGGWGNRRLGKTMIETAHAAFGAPPATWS